MQEYTSLVTSHTHDPNCFTNAMGHVKSHMGMGHKEIQMYEYGS